MINADAHFATGHSHLVCQDYAAVLRLSEDCWRAVVSDGCSGSPHTDFGSRILARLALASQDPHSHVGLLEGAMGVVEVLGLPVECLDATLLTASLDDSTVRLTAAGDGVMEVEYEDYSALMDMEFSGGAPMYLRYLRPGDFERYVEQYGARLTLNGNKELPLSRDNYALRFEGPREGLRRVSLYSDGVKSFRRPGAAPGAWEAVPVAEVLAQINAVKVAKGAFLGRRMRKFLGDFCPRNNWVHDDDVSVATILVGGEQ